MKLENSAERRRLATAVKNAFELPYVPKKPTKKPILKDYELSEKLLKENETQKETSRSDRKFGYWIFLIAVFAIVCFAYQGNSKNGDIVGGIALSAFVCFFIGAISANFILTVPATEIDKQKQQFDKDTRSWDWWTNTYPKMNNKN